jgi:hypothetical protein
MMTTPPLPRPPSPWKVVHGFMGLDNLSIDISMTEGSRPRYSIKIGKRSKEGHMLPFIPVNFDGVNPRDITSEVEKLTAQALQWIADKNMELIVQRDTPPETPASVRSSGKTARDRQKKIDRNTK